MKGLYKNVNSRCTSTWKGGSRGRDRMVVGFTTTYAISAYHHWYICIVSSNVDQGELYNIMW